MEQRNSTYETNNSEAHTHKKKNQTTLRNIKRKALSLKASAFKAQQCRRLLIGNFLAL